MILSITMLMSIFVAIDAVNITATASTTERIKITYDGQVVDSFNGVDAVYKTGTGNTNSGEYSCAGYVSKYYRQVYNVTVNNLVTGATPNASNGSFSVTSSPEIGDIGYQTSSGSGHWFIIKEIDGGGTYTIIEQNWKWASNGATYCSKNRKVSSSTVSNFKVFRWSNKPSDPNSFYGLPKVDLGTNFYSMIIRNENWTDLSDENGNVAVNNNGNIIWYFTKTSDGGYKIKNVATGKYLDVNGAEDTEGNNVQTWEPNDSAAQVWYIYGLYDGEYVFKPKCSSNRVLNVYAPTGDASIYTFDPNDMDMRFHLWTDIHTYTISYNMNGGSGSIGNQTKVEFSPLTLSGTKPTRTGYEFVGWNTSASATTAQYQPGGKYTANGNATLYAVWKAKQVKVTFYRNQNGSDSTTATQTFTYGASGQAFTDKKWTKDGYTQLGWSEDRNATAKQYSTTNTVGSDWINQKSPTLNLYAVWKINAPTDKPVITNLSDSYNAGDNLTITWNKVNRATSYYVTIWRNPGTESSKIVDTSVTTNSYTLNNLTVGKYGIIIDAKNESGKTTSELYNFYVPFTIKYDLNGGTGTISPTYKKLDIQCNLNTTKPTRTDYTFVGWSTNKDSVTAQYQPGDKYNSNEDVTLYAVWVSNQYTVNISETNCKVNITATHNGNRI